MIRLWLRLSSFVALVSIVTLSSRAALAASHDAEAIKLREAAIYQDYLATDFPSAEKKLTQALTLCEKPSDCTPATRARLHCDLGVVYFASQKPADGRAQFAAALQEDQSVTLDPDLTSADLQKEFAAIKGGGSAPGGAQTGGGAAAVGTAGAAGPAPAAGAGEQKDAGGGEATPAENEGETAPPKSAPKETTSSSDCPPGFPGCKAAETTCSNDDDCSNGEKCVNEVCRSEKEAAEQGTPGKANWVSLAFQLDIPLLPAKKDVCLGGQGYSCFNSDGSWYDGVPEPGGGGQIQSSGLQIGTKRVLAGFDHVFFDNFTLGGALGFAFGGGPTRKGGSAFLPVQVEARGKYWFGRRPMGRSGFRFYLTLNGGMAEVAASIQTFVFDPMSPNPMQAQSKNAWFHMGRGFAGGGAGVMYAITPMMGVILELRAMEMFPTSGQNFAAQLAYAIGF